MIEEIRKQIEDAYYWDARVRRLECNYFGDEVELAYEDGEAYIVYRFEECYITKIEHIYAYPKDIPAKKLTAAQIPYFMQDVDVNMISEENKELLEFKINMWPIYLYIVCRKFNLSRVPC